MRLFIRAFFFFILVSPTAQAARISLVGVANSSEPNEPGTEYSGRPGYGTGLLLEFRLMPAIGLELGALFLQRRFEYSSTLLTNTKTTTSAKVYEFPVLLRMHLARLFSLGIGGYYAKVSGDATDETKAENGSTQSTSYSLGSRNQTTTDYGALVSLALYMRIVPLMHFTIDGRYAVGLKNNSTAAGSERKYNDMQLLAGLQFGF